MASIPVNPVSNVPADDEPVGFLPSAALARLALIACGQEKALRTAAFLFGLKWLALMLLVGGSLLLTGAAVFWFAGNETWPA